MSSKTSKHSESSSKKQPSKSKSKTGKNDDWADITDPEERRRIQNRLAQRKFRRKNQESKEQTERDSQNEENAHNIYHSTEAGDLAEEDNVSGLPWGGINIKHVVSRGREHESRRGSRRGGHVSEGAQYANTYTADYPAGYRQAPSYGSSGGEEYYYEEESPYYHDYDQGGDPNQAQGYYYRS